jgi:hypothetical protein
MAWEHIGEGIDGASSGIRWDAGQLQGCDPYLVWADATSAKRAHENQAPVVHLLVELRDATAGVQFLRSIHGEPFALSQSAWPRPRYLTCKLPLGQVKHLADKYGRQQVVRFTLMAARQVWRQQQPLQKSTQPFLLHLLQTKSLVLGAGPAATPAPPPALLGVIDDGCPFAHPSFWTDDDTRKVPKVAVLWHQGRGEAAAGVAERQQSIQPPDPDDPWRPMEARPSLAPGPQPASGYFYGQELPLLERVQHAGRFVGPPAAPYSVTRPGPDGYKAARYPRRPPHWTHGAAVLGLAAAAHPPQPISPDRRQGEIAERPIVFVQLPEPTVDDTSAGSLAGHVLDGIRYILGQAIPQDDGKEQPVVVNISFGHHAGPHDGTSMFEQAAAELLQHNRQLELVVAAGNSHLSRGHASGHLMRNKPQSLHWQLPPDNPVDAFIEIWLDGDARQVSITLHPPGGAGSEDLTTLHDEAHLWTLPSGQACCGVVFAPCVAQGKNGTMALIAVAPTARQRQSPKDDTSVRLFMAATQTRRKVVEGLAGCWQIELLNNGSADVRWHAWVERSDVAPGRSFGSALRPRQSYLLDGPRSHVTPECTLNGIATLAHERFHVVGAMNGWDASLADYSAAGPARDGTRADGPTLVTVGDESRLRPGLRSTGLNGGSVARVGGSSIAAAVYSQVLAQDRSHGGRPGTPVLRPHDAWETPQRKRFPTDPELASPLLRGECVRAYPPGGDRGDK